MNWCKALCALSIAIYGSACLAQDITDVEAKPYGSYTGGAIDTVDLATGNLMLNIPLVSFPQLGSLPPLSFSVELNNAPYSQIAYDCDYLGVLNSNNQPVSPQDPTYVIDCEMVSSRYDTSPPGAEYQYSGMNPVEPQYNSVQNPTYDPNCENGNDSTPCGYEYTWGYEDKYLSLQNMGAYLTSSFEGGIAVGQNNSTTDGNGNPEAQAYQFSLIDPSGTTHELESDLSNWNTYRTSDGSGYSFIPSGSGNSYDPFNPAEYDGLGYFDSNQVWLRNASDANTSTESGLRLGTLYSPTGIKYTSTIQTYSPDAGQGTKPGTGSSYYTPQALITTETDPSGNAITRGAWYWSGYYSVPNSSFADIQNIYATHTTPLLPSSYHGPYYKDSVGRLIPDAVTMQATHYGWQQSQFNASMNWGVPGPSGTTLPYTINYTTISNVQTWTAQGNTMTPDPSTDIIVNGYAISSINLPNGTSWGFTYDSQSTANPPAGASSGDLIGVTTPAGGSISYTYTSTPLPPLVVPVGQQLTGGDLYVYRCNGACHAVASRTESDGLSSSIPGIHSWTTHYTYGMYTQAQQQSLFPSCPMVPMPAGEPSVFYAFWTTETDPLGNDTVHSFCPVGVSNAIPVANQYHETMTQSYQESAPSPTTGTGTGGTGTLLKTVTTSLQYQADIPTPNGQGNAGNINILPTQITTTIPSGSTTASTTDGRQYSSLFTATKIGCGQGFNTATDAVNDRYSTCEPYPSGSLSSSPPRTIPIYYLSPTTEKTYSGTSTSGTPLRTTWTAYMFSTQNPPTGYANTYMSALPLSVANTDPTGNTTYSQTTYGYDTTGRGYLVSQSQWLNTTGQNVTTQTWYNSLGMPYKSQDAKGNLTFVSGFMNQCSAGTSTYPQIVTKAYGSTTTLPEMSTYNFDCYTNAMTSVTDPNGIQTSYNYTTDPLGRLTQAKYGINSTIPSTITLSYPSMTEVDINQDKSSLNDGVITKKTIFDGLGRTIQQNNSAGYIVTTIYNPDGEVASVTNPQGADSVYGTSSSSGGTDGTTYYYYDPLGRVIKETEQDGSTLWWCYNGIQDLNYPQPTGLCSSNPSTTNSGAVSWIDSTDENGSHHQLVSNALGQLIAAIEPNPQTNVLALETDYTYDPNGNLSNVNQHGAAGETARIRSFNYDSLSRLLCASNPETSSASCPTTATGSYLSGTTGYIYDLNGNLQSKTDARGIATSYTYDGLNRVLSKSYSSNDPSGAPSSCYQYDSASTYGIGRLGNQWTQKGTCSSSPGAGVPSLTSISAYDAVGRVKSEQQCVFSNCSTDYPSLPTYSYDLAGDLTKYSDGLGTRYFTKQYDKATRLQTMTAGPSSFTLFSAQGYGASGGVTSAFYGTTTPNAGVSQSRTYDSRLRVTGETDGQN